MQYQHLGRTGLQVSRIALGTMNFGDQTNEPDSFSIMNDALDAGVNFFDTADVYGIEQSPDIKQGSGLSEEIVGRWLAEDPSRRDRIVLATKLYQPMGPGPNDRHLSAYHIRRACEASLRRLNTDHIDLYQMHHVDRGTPWEEKWQAMEQLVREGKITYVGSSNHAGWDIATAQGDAKARHFMGLVSRAERLQTHRSHVELEVIPALEYHGNESDPVEPERGRAPRRRAREGDRGPPPQSLPTRSSSTGSSSKHTKRSARTSGSILRTSRLPGSSTSRSSPPRSSARAPATSSPRNLHAATCTSPTTHCSSSTHLPGPGGSAPEHTL